MSTNITLDSQGKEEEKVNMAEQMIAELLVG